MCVCVCVCVCVTSHNNVCGFKMFKITSCHFKVLHCNDDITVPKLLVSEHRGFPPDAHAHANVPDGVLQLQVASGDQLVHQQTVLRYPATPNPSASN